jgi:hypothetical protein
MEGMRNKGRREEEIMLLEVREKRKAKERQEKDIPIEGRRRGSREWTGGYEECKGREG